MRITPGSALSGSFDSISQAQDVQEINPALDRVMPLTEIQAATEVSESSTAASAPLNCIGFTWVYLEVVYSTGNEDGLEIIVKMLGEGNSSDEIQWESYNEDGAGVRTMTKVSWQYTDTGKYAIILPVSGVPYIKVYEGRVGAIATTGTVQLKYAMFNN